MRTKISTGKISNNCPLSKWRSFEFFLYTKQKSMCPHSNRWQSKHNQIYRGILVWVHLAKIKVDLLATMWPVFIIVINTSYSAFVAGFTQKMTALGHYFEIRIILQLVFISTLNFTEGMFFSNWLWVYIWNLSGTRLIEPQLVKCSRSLEHREQNWH